MDQKLQDVISKVQKLLQLSKSSNANESAAAMAAANKLIDEYRLSETDLTADFSNPLVEDDGFVYETGRIIPWKNYLIYVLTSHYGVAYYNSNIFPEGRKVSRYKLLGRKSDIEIVRYLFSWLNLEVQRLVNLEAKGSGRIAVASYCEGFVKGVAEQLGKSREEVKKMASETAIIKLDSRGEEASAFMYGKHKDIKQVKDKSYRRINGNAFYAGKERGKNVHLGAALPNGSKPKLLGS